MDGAGAAGDAGAAGGAGAGAGAAGGAGAVATPAAALAAMLGSGFRDYERDFARTFVLALSDRQRAAAAAEGHAAGPAPEPEPIAKGGFGEVYNVEARDDEARAFVRSRCGGHLPPLVCKKMLLRDRFSFIAFKAESALREGQAFQRLGGHPGVSFNVETYARFSAAEQEVYFVLPLAPGMPRELDDFAVAANRRFNDAGASRGDFWRWLGLNNGLTENAAQAVALQALSAVRFMHARGVMHRDIKADNMLIFGAKDFGGEHVPLVAVCDLGTVKVVPEPVRIGVAPAPRSNTAAVGPAENPKYIGTMQ
jgi:serine/threonine protein kinase